LKVWYGSFLKLNLLAGDSNAGQFSSGY